MTAPSSGRSAVSRMRWLRGRVRQKTTTSATSSAGIIPSSSSGVRPYPSSSAKSVATPPGQTFVQRTPCSRSSWSSARVSPTWPNFDAQYTASPGSPRRPASDATVTRSPAPLAIRCGIAARDRVDRPLEVDVDHLLEVLERACRRACGTSPRPRSRRRCRAGRSARPSPRRPPRPDRVAHVARRARVRPRARGRRRFATRARPRRPRSTSERATAAPMPRLAPVTNATLPSSFMLSSTPRIAGYSAR